MCIVIDANTLSKVFDQTNAQHSRFKPVFRWVMSGNGSVVYGGTKYIKELGRGRYASLFVELVKIRRAVEIPKKAVDDRAAELKRLVPDDDFDDEHIVALIGISGCRLVCTGDKRSLPYLRRRDLYPQGVRIPTVYRSQVDQRHCCDGLIADICPKRILRSRQRKKPKARPKIELMARQP